MSKELLSTPNTLHYTTLHCNFSLLDSWDLGGAAHHPHSRSRSGGDAAALRARAGRSQSCDEDEQPALLPRLGSLRKPKRSCILGCMHAAAAPIDQLVATLLEPTSCSAAAKLAGLHFVFTLPTCTHRSFLVFVLPHMRRRRINLSVNRSSLMHPILAQA